MKKNLYHSYIIRQKVEKFSNSFNKANELIKYIFYLQYSFKRFRKIMRIFYFPLN